MATDSITAGGVSPFSPLSEILKAPLRRENIEFAVGDGAFLKDFEDAWGKFLGQNPELVPRGAREERILELQNAAKKEEEAKLNILKEMEQQVEFFKASCEALEEVYSGKMQAAIDSQSHIQEDLQKRLDDVRSADKIQQETLPWHHFLYELDQLAASVKPEQAAKSKKTIRPSNRAMVLTDHATGCPGDVVLRSYKIDHAILTNHITILTKEVDRYKKLVKAQEMTGKFLKDFGAWGILSKAQSQEDGSSDSLTDGDDIDIDY